MSNLEVFFLTQEVAELRKLIGGRAVDIKALVEGRKKINKTVDQELEEVQKEIKELRDMLTSLTQEMSKYKAGAIASVAVSAEAEAAVSNITQDLKASTDKLESALLTETEKL